jgi:hypothetical protein
LQRKRNLHSNNTNIFRVQETLIIPTPFSNEFYGGVGYQPPISAVSNFIAYTNLLQDSNDRLYFWIVNDTRICLQSWQPGEGSATQSDICYSPLPEIPPAVAVLSSSLIVVTESVSLLHSTYFHIYDTSSRSSPILVNSTLFNRRVYHVLASASNTHLVISYLADAWYVDKVSLVNYQSVLKQPIITGDIALAATPLEWLSVWMDKVVSYRYVYQTVQKRFIDYYTQSIYPPFIILIVVDCVTSKYGNECQFTCGNCNGQGVCSNSFSSTGGCVCSPPYNGTNCNVCYEGYYNVDSSCVPCEAGKITYMDEDFVSYCVACPEGFYNPLPLQTTCNLCANGTLSTQKGASKWYSGNKLIIHY